VIAVDLLSVGVVLAMAVVYAVDTIRDRLDPKPPEGTTNHVEWLYATNQIILATSMSTKTPKRRRFRQRSNGSTASAPN
jgi:hypothetical protein